MCRLLGLPHNLSAISEISDAAHLPARVLSGDATEDERALWKAYYEGAMHEILSAEFVNALAEHVRLLLAATTQTDTPTDMPVVLEVGAGSGALTAQLSKQLAGYARLVATDNYSTGIGTMEGATVEKLNCKEALEFYSPTVVLVSWMPSGLDFTLDIRACASVRYYLLVGPSDSATCGDVWATWGKVPEIGCARCGFEGCERCDYGLDESTAKPFARDGWLRTECEHVHAFQICRFDSRVARGFSTCVCFSKT